MNDPAITIRRSENPFTLTFWLGEVDPRPGAIFRIVLGLTVLHYLANLSVDVTAFLSDDGILPRSTLAVQMRPGLFSLVGAPWAVGALYAAGCLALLAFTLGYRTRFAAFASWIFMASLMRRDVFISDGGDELVANLLFLSVFTDLGRAYSLDVLLGRKRVSPAPALGVRFLSVHVALLYLLTGVAKAQAGWFRDNSVFEGLQLTGFLRPPGEFLLHHPEFARMSQLGTIVLELAFAFLAFSPFKVRFSRALAVLAGVGIQLGILLTMRVGVFTEATISASLILIQPEWLDWIAARWRAAKALAPRMSPSLPTASEFWAKASAPLAVCAFGFLVLHAFTFLTSGPFGGRLPGTDALGKERRILSLQQSTNLFTDHDSIPVWHSPGVTTSGDSIDVLASTRPGVTPSGPGWRMSRWYKLNFHTKAAGFPFQGIGQYLCRDYSLRHSVQLRSFDIIETVTPPLQPGQPTATPVVRRTIPVACTQ